MFQSSLSSNLRVIILALIVAAAMMGLPQLEKSAESGQGKLTEEYLKVKSVKKKFKRALLSEIFSSEPYDELKNTKVIFDCIFLAPYSNAATEAFTGFIVSDISGQQHRVLLIDRGFTSKISKMQAGTRITVPAVTIFKKGDSFGKKFGKQLLSAAISGVSDAATSNVDNKYGKQGVAIGENLINNQIAGDEGANPMTVIAVNILEFKYRQVNDSYFRDHDLAVLVKEDVYSPSNSNDSIALGNLKIWVEPVSNASDSFTAKGSTRKEDSDIVMMYPVFMNSGNIPIFRIEIQNIGNKIEDFNNLLINYIPKGSNPVQPASYSTFFPSDDTASDKNNALTRQMKKHLTEMKITDFDPSFKLIPGYKYSTYIFFNYDLLSGQSAGELAIFYSGVTEPNAKSAGAANLVKINYKVKKGSGLKIDALGKDVMQWESQFLVKPEPGKKTETKPESKATAPAEPTKPIAVPKEPVASAPPTSGLLQRQHRQ